MVRKALRITGTIVAILMATAPGFAATSVKLHVSATVLSYLSFNGAQQVTTYQVRSEDVQRGYVDLPNAVTVTLRTNVAKGITIAVDSWGGGRILLRENRAGDFRDSSINLSTDGYRAGELISKNFDSRIMLPADTQEGVYPLTIALMPMI